MLGVVSGGADVDDGWGDEKRKRRTIRTRKNSMPGIMRIMRWGDFFIMTEKFRARG